MCARPTVWQRTASNWPCTSSLKSVNSNQVCRARQPDDRTDGRAGGGVSGGAKPSRKPCFLFSLSLSSFSISSRGGGVSGRSKSPSPLFPCSPARPLACLLACVTSRVTKPYSVPGGTRLHTKIVKRKKFAVSTGLTDSLTHVQSSRNQDCGRWEKERKKERIDRIELNTRTKELGAAISRN